MKLNASSFIHFRFTLRKYTKLYLTTTVVLFATVASTS